MSKNQKSVLPSVGVSLRDAAYSHFTSIGLVSLSLSNLANTVVESADPLSIAGAGALTVLFAASAVNNIRKVIHDADSVQIERELAQSSSLLARHVPL